MEKAEVLRAVTAGSDDEAAVAAEAADDGAGANAYGRSSGGRASRARDCRQRANVLCIILYCCIQPQELGTNHSTGPRAALLTAGSETDIDMFAPESQPDVGF